MLKNSHFGVTTGAGDASAGADHDDERIGGKMQSFHTSPLLTCCDWVGQALEPAMNQWRQRINRIAASFEHANKSQIPQEPALKAAASAATSAAALPGQLSSQQSSTSEESPSESASTAAPKSASKSADGSSSSSSSSKGKDDQQKERQQSHAETSSSNSKPAPEVATPVASSSPSEADVSHFALNFFQKPWILSKVAIAGCCKKCGSKFFAPTLWRLCHTGIPWISHWGMRMFEAPVLLSCLRLQVRQLQLWGDSQAHFAVTPGSLGKLLKCWQNACYKLAGPCTAGS